MFLKDREVEFKLVDGDLVLPGVVLEDACEE